MTGLPRGPQSAKAISTELQVGSSHRDGGRGVREPGVENPDETSLTIDRHPEVPRAAGHLECRHWARRFFRPLFPFHRIAQPVVSFSPLLPVSDPLIVVQSLLFLITADVVAEGFVFPRGMFPPEPPMIA